MPRRPRWQTDDPRREVEASRYEKPIPSREYLLETLREAGEPLDADALATRLRLKDRAQSASARWCATGNCCRTGTATSS
jgi:hypothetical protein